MEKPIDPLPSGRSSNVIDFEARKAEMMQADAKRLWVGGVVKHGRVVITLDVLALSPDATRAFAKTLLMLADTAERQAAEEGFDE